MGTGIRLSLSSLTTMHDLHTNNTAQRSRRRRMTFMLSIHAASTCWATMCNHYVTNTALVACGLNSLTSQPFGPITQSGSFPQESRDGRAGQTDFRRTQLNAFSCSIRPTNQPTNLSPQPTPPPPPPPRPPVPRPALGRGGCGTKARASNQWPRRGV